MKIERIDLYALTMPLKNPFETSFGRESQRDLILVRTVQDGLVGWAECVVSADPYYNAETQKTAWHILEDFLIPLVLGQSLGSPREVSDLFARVRGHQMAKSALESAIWVGFAEAAEQPLWRYLGGVKDRIDVGISVGLEDTVKEQIDTVEHFWSQGYKRIKVKIRPGRDVELIAAIRERMGAIPLMADANSAYRLEDIETLKALDRFDLMMIEQPLSHEDIVDHAKLQAQLSTPICLDESIHSAEDARKAFDIGSARIVNVKIGRIGGLGEALKLHDLALSRGVPLWCGGMLESGIGRAHNVAITTLPGFTLPGDTAASARYWERDIIVPEVTMTDGQIAAPTAPGLGYAVDESAILHYTIQHQSFKP